MWFFLLPDNLCLWFGLFNPFICNVIGHIVGFMSAIIPADLFSNSHFSFATLNILSSTLVNFPLKLFFSTPEFTLFSHFYLSLIVSI